MNTSSGSLEPVPPSNPIGDEQASVLPSVPQPAPLDPFDPGKAWIFGTLAAVVLGVPAAYSFIPKLLAAAGLALRKRVSLKETCLLNPVKWKDLVFPVCLGLSLFTLEVSGWYLLDIVFGGRLHGWADLFPTAVSGSPVHWFVAGVLVVPIVEEFFFRGFFMNSLREWGPGWAVFVPSLIFAAFHHPAGIPGAFVLGVSAGILTQRSGSVYPALSLHMAFNLTVAAIKAIGDADTGHGASIAACLCLLAFTIAGIRLFWKEYKRLWKDARDLWRRMVSEQNARTKLRNLLFHWTYIIILAEILLTVVFVVYYTVTGRQIEI